MEANLSYWRFIEEWHPKYWSDDRVLLGDILVRHVEKEEVDDMAIDAYDEDDE